MRRFTSFVVGTLLGGLVGTTLAFLFAPASGAALRQRIADYYDQVVTEVSRAANEKRIELETQLAELRAPAETPVKK